MLLVYPYYTVEDALVNEATYVRTEAMKAVEHLVNVLQTPVHQRHPKQLPHPTLMQTTAVGAV